MRFLVITRVPEAGNRGNLALATEVFFDNDTNNTANWDEPLPRIGEAVGNPMLMLALRAPVFTLGEVLIVDENGRELAGAGRKPDKWDVGFEIFDDVAIAVERAQATFEPAQSS